jgi:hypothetical protein
MKVLLIWKYMVYFWSFVYPILWYIYKFPTDSFAEHSMFSEQGSTFNKEQLYYT